MNKIVSDEDVIKALEYLDELKDQIIMLDDVFDQLDAIHKKMFDICQSLESSTNERAKEFMRQFNSRSSTYAMLKHRYANPSGKELREFLND